MGVYIYLVAVRGLIRARTIFEENGTGTGQVQFNSVTGL